MYLHLAFHAMHAGTAIYNRWGYKIHIFQLQRKMVVPNSDLKLHVTVLQSGKIKGGSVQLLSAAVNADPVNSMCKQPAVSDLQSGRGGCGTSWSWLFLGRSSPGDPSLSSPLWGSRCSHGSDQSTTLKLKQVQHSSIRAPLTTIIPHVQRWAESFCRKMVDMNISSGPLAVHSVQYFYTVQALYMGNKHIDLG